MTVTAPGYAPCRALFAEEAPGGPLVARVEMQRAGEIDLVANLGFAPKWSPRLEMFEGGQWRSRESFEGGEWRSRLLPRVIAEDVHLGRTQFRNLWPGTYRVVDAETGVRTEAVDVVAGASSRMDLDLHESREVEVELRDPEERRVTEGRLIVEGAGLETRTWSVDWRPRPTVVRVPGDRPVTIRAEHDELVPDPSAPRVSVAKDLIVELRLVRR